MYNVPVLVSGHQSQVFFRGSVLLAVNNRNRPDCGVRHLGGRHREFHVTIFVQLLGNLVVRRQGHTAHEVMCSVRA